MNFWLRGKASIVGTNQSKNRYIASIAGPVARAGSGLVLKVIQKQIKKKRTALTRGPPHSTLTRKAKEVKRLRLMI